MRKNSRYMQIHILITLTSGTVFHKARATAFDLYMASSFLLYMFDIRPTMANNLS